MNQAVDPELRSIHLEAMRLYNRETAVVLGTAALPDLIRATCFLAEQATIFADAALVLMEDSKQPLNVPAALLRTCLEAQARANHLIGANGVERDARAKELVQFMYVGHEFYYKSAIQKMKEFIPDNSKLLERDRPYFPGVKCLLTRLILPICLR